jgi:ABC-2 type transport system ATP-binding protein
MTAEAEASGLALAVNGLVKRYGGVTALNGITLRVEAGQLYGILGPNGAGKSTLIRILSGLLKPDQGTVKLYASGGAGNPVKHVGLCPQELVIWEGLTLWEQLLFMASMHDVAVREARKRADGLLEALGLSGKKHARASALSGGMKRRLNIMLALMHDPEIVILDEPHAGLDPQSRILVRDFLKELSGRKTVIVTTHDMEEAEKLAGRVAVIDQGRVLAEDTPEGLKRRIYANEFVEITLADTGSLPSEAEALLRREFPGLIRHGTLLRLEAAQPLELAGQLQKRLHDYKAPVQDIRIRRATLEDVFIAMTGRGLRE